MQTVVEFALRKHKCAGIHGKSRFITLQSFVQTILHSAKCTLQRIWQGFNEFPTFNYTPKLLNDNT